jgi:hypothetical protein
MRVAILQSNYLPWKGYFDIIGMVDLFIFHDDLQYTKGDWRNRNLIKTPSGPKWITVPCGTSERRLICEVELPESSWQLQHWRQIESVYRNTLHFDKYKDYFHEMLIERKWKNLSEMNQTFIRDFAKDFLGMTTTFDDSRRYNLQLSKGARVLELLKNAGATSYLSGPAAKNYLNPGDFEEAGIELLWMDYSGYSEYPQAHPPFTHQVSILDMFFNLGSNTAEYMKFRNQGRMGGLE